MIYDTLFSTEAAGEIRPQMVDTTEVSADKLTYTFTLRDGLKWHDGQPVTADACAPSIKPRAARPRPDPPRSGAGRAAVLWGRSSCPSSPPSRPRTRAPSRSG